MIRIEQFTADQRLIKKFIEVGEKIYRTDSAWTAPNKSKLFAQLSQKNPFFGEGELAHFLASDDKEYVGRVSALINLQAMEEGQRIGFIGFFESVQNSEVAEKLLHAALFWLREKNISLVRGPINGSTWHSYRLMTKGFQNAPFLLEPYNPTYYPSLFERAGFQIKKRYVSSIVTYHERQIQSAEEKRREFVKMGYTIRSLNRQAYEKELRLLYELSTHIFKDNWDYTDITWDEFKALYDGLNRIIDPELILFALNPEQKPIGFVFAIPDYARAVRALHGESHLIAKLRFTMARRQRPEAVIIKTLGVLPEARQTGIGSVLVALVHQAAQQKGYTQAIHALMSEENVSRKISEKAGEAFKEYVVYEIKL